MRVGVGRLKAQCLFKAFEGGQIVAVPVEFAPFVVQLMRVLNLGCLGGFGSDLRRHLRRVLGLGRREGKR